MSRKTAVVLFNLGGPDSLDAVRPFLFNLFNDPAIINLSRPMRWLLAKVISSRRAPVAQDIYRRIGGSSPLLENTKLQARALEKRLNDPADTGEFRCFIAMRYWHPMADETVAAVKAFAPDRIVLLPLYPQYSGTTTGSSLGNWREAAARGGLTVETRTVCCYPRNAGFVQSVASLVRQAVEKTGSSGGVPRVLFSAHGLPKKFVEAGDPYQWQVEETVRSVVAEIGDDSLDWQICFQSRVGSLEWLRPYTEDALAQAGRDNVPVVMVPIAFTSEHSETLVELDIEYRELAEKAGVPHYYRVSTVCADAVFISGLAKSVRRVLKGSACLVSGEGRRICPANLGVCAFSK
ncbi:MAG: ferrochelatase [Alphaproteobacteria bacterium]